MRTAALYRKITRDTKTETKIQTPSAESAKENFAALRLAPTAPLQTKNIMGLTHSTRLLLAQGRPFTFKTARNRRPCRAS
jgi:hypothetical protein